MTGTVQPLLGACMIVRDEADILGSALECLRGFCDEMVVVDTGSRDRTVELARAAGATVHAIPWSDDFSAARNAALEHARSRWVLVLDADEWIAPEDGRRLREQLATAGPVALTMRQHNYVRAPGVRGFVPNESRCEGTAAYPGFLLARQTRVFPNDARIRYEGVVHEEVTESLRRAGIERVDTEYVIHHFGKVRDEAVRERKQRLYTRLSEAKAGSSQDPQAWRELAIQYLELGRDADARAWLSRAADAFEDGPERAHVVATMAKIDMRAGRLDDARDFLEVHFARLAPWLDPWEVMGELLLRGGEVGRALELLEHAVELFPRQPHLLRLLAECRLSLRRWHGARTTAAELLELVPSDVVARTVRLLARLREDDPSKVMEALTEFDRRADPVETLPPLLERIRREGDAELAWRLLRASSSRLGWVALEVEGRWWVEEGHGLVAARLIAAIPPERTKAELWASVDSACGLELSLKTLSGAGDEPAALLARALAFSRAGLSRWADDTLSPMDRDPRLRGIAGRARQALRTAAGEPV